MHRMKRGVLIFVGLMLLLACGIAINNWIETAQYEKFYVEHPMLRAMRDHPPVRTRGADPWIAILLSRVPTGTTRSDALRILADEGMSCQPSHVPTPHSLACGPRSQPKSVSRWYIQVTLDPDDKVTGGRVLKMKAG
jgi:hypothetical protein